MADVRLSSVDEALRALEQLSTEPPPVRRPVRRSRRALKRRLWRGLLRLLFGALAAVLPFALLVRTAVFLYAGYGMAAWASLGIAAMGVAVLLTAYVAGAAYKLRGRLRFSWAAKTAGALMAVYCGYALVYVSAANVKTSEVAATYTALHPLLRLATSTLILTDGDLVITAAAREQADYARMGLPVQPRSLHYPQADGWVHAIDLRTSGRSAWQNAWMQAYFEAMGFQTLRHTGTADHLHVALRLPEAP